MIQSSHLELLYSYHVYLRCIVLFVTRIYVLSDCLSLLQDELCALFVINRPHGTWWLIKAICSFGLNALLQMLQGGGLFAEVPCRLLLDARTDDEEVIVAKEGCSRDGGWTVRHIHKGLFLRGVRCYRLLNLWLPDRCLPLPLQLFGDEDVLFVSDFTSKARNNCWF